MLGNQGKAEPTPQQTKTQNNSFVLNHYLFCRGCLCPISLAFCRPIALYCLHNTGKMILFVRSILWDLHIPQEAATVLFEDNDGCTAMGNAQKPSPCTRHIDIKYFSLCEWVERDLMLLEHIDTSINMSDHMTKGLQTSVNPIFDLAKFI